MSRRLQFDHASALRDLSDGLSIAECAEKYGVSIHTIYRLVHDGHPPTAPINDPTKNYNGDWYTWFCREWNAATKRLRKRGKT